MHENTIRDTEIYSALAANHKVFNKQKVRKALRYANNKHFGQMRKTGEPYIHHPMRVAKIVADLGFESDVVIAAILHDIVEDCNTSIDEIEADYGKEVALMVNSLTSVNTVLHKAQGYTKTEIDAISDAHLQKTIDEKGLFIKIADRLDNLRTINGVKESKQINKSQHTREILIPLVKKIGAHQLVDELEELCFKIEHPDRHKAICNKYDAICDSNSLTTQTIEKLFNELFLEKSILVPNELSAYQDSIADFIFEKRSCISIFRHLNKHAENLNLEFDQLLHKKYVPLYDLTLVIKDDLVTENASLRPIDVFFKFYEDILIEKDICVTNYCRTTNANDRYLLLHDQMDNMYRLFVKSERECLLYKLGHIIETDASFTFVDIDDVDPRDTYKKKIKVFKRDGSAMYIDEGSTVLDFAFALHSDIGYHFKYAKIDKSQTQHPAYTRLNEGDTVTIVHDNDIRAQIDWFKYVKTNKAVAHLVKYFSH